MKPITITALSDMNDNTINSSSSSSKVGKEMDNLLSNTIKGDNDNITLGLNGSTIIGNGVSKEKKGMDIDIDIISSEEKRKTLLNSLKPILKALHLINYENNSIKNQMGGSTGSGTGGSSTSSSATTNTIQVIQPVLEVPPKWTLLLEVIEEIRNECFNMNNINLHLVQDHVLIIVKDERTKLQISDVLVFGIPYLMDQRYRWFVSQQVGCIL